MARIAMRKSIVWTLIAALALLVILLAMFGLGRHGLVEVAPPLERGSTVAELESPDSSIDAASDRATARAATATADLPSSTARERCAIVGRIVDDLHRPVADAKVELRAQSGPWSVQEDAPEVLVPTPGGTVRTR